MDESRSIIFQDSNRIISKLQLLSLFFEDDTIFKIYVRTQVIHKLFESNQELDIHKLELFHLQFTESIIELLRKIKNNNEKNVVLATDEIQVNEALIRNLSDGMQLEESFGHAMEGHTKVIDIALEKLYQNLSDYSKDKPFPKTITDFSDHFAEHFFYEISPATMISLLDYDLAKLYKNGYGAIEKKLMGLQCKHNFKNIFYAGFKTEDTVIEVYRLANFILEDDDNEYFIFDPAQYLFLGCPKEKIMSIKVQNGLSKKAKIVTELNEKNIHLKNSLPIIKTNIPDGVGLLLTDYHNRVESINFLDLIDDFDIQANILKTMLNTNDI